MDNETTIMTEQEIAERLLEIAKADEQPGLVELQAARKRIYDTYLSCIDGSIRAIEDVAAIRRLDLKNDFLDHVAAGGDPKISPSITFKRTKKFEYDKKHALQFVLDNDLPYIRVKKELDATPFKKACQAGKINYADGEEINTPSVAIGQLGDLLILAGLK